VALALLAPIAQAHHSIFIREVRASAPAPAGAFVELQSYLQGQNGIAGSQLLTYDAAGASSGAFVLGADVPFPESQRTILIGAAAPADFVVPGLSAALSPAGGAVCLPEATPVDCVSWGSFGSPLPFPGGGPAAPAIVEGLSLTRTIARGCASALDAPDDSDNSAADFALGTPTPRSNATAPTELECVPCDGVDATIIGTDGVDKLRGTKRRDVVAALAGADKVKGLGGNDLICGGIGKDALEGGRGRDRLIGGRGRDTCRAADGDVARSCEVRKAASGVASIDRKADTASFQGTANGEKR
jgi:hypothetical protein